MHSLSWAKVQGAEGKWETSVAIKQEWLKLSSWVLPALPPLITDILISLDDKCGPCWLLDLHSSAWHDAVRMQQPAAAVTEQ